MIPIKGSLDDDIRFQDSQRDTDSQCVDACCYGQPEQCFVAERICFAVLIFFLRTVVYHFTSQVKQQDESDPVVEGCNVFLESDTGPDSPELSLWPV